MGLTISTQRSRKHPDAPPASDGDSADWKPTPLGDLGTLRSGGTPSMANPRLWNGDIPWVSPKDMKVPRLVEAQDHVSQEAIGRGTRLVQPGAVLIVIRGMILAHSFPVAHVDRPLTFNQDIKAFVCGDRLSSEFLLRWLEGNASRLRSLATASTHGTMRVPTGDLLKTELLLPPVPEQDAVAAALSDVDGLIASLDRLIAKKRAIKQAAMQQLLTGKTRLPGFLGKWDTKPLRALADITMGQSPASVFYNVRGNGLPLIQGNADIENRRSIARVWTTQASKRCVTDDILLTVRAPVGAVGIASESACLGRGVCGLRPLVDSSFLFQALVFAEPRWKVLEQGSTFTSANRAQVGQFELFVPIDAAEQRSIGACLTDMDTELQRLEARAAKASSLKQGMMQALLTGRVRLPVSPGRVTLVPEPAAQAESSRAHNWQINEAVVIGVLAKHFGSEAYPLGRKRYTKLSYLLHRHVEKQADGYLKKAAGPYNPSTKYGGPEKIALKNRYVREHVNGQYRGFVAADAIAQAVGYFEKWYGSEALTWLEQFRMRKNDALGVLATVDMAAQELRGTGREVTVPAIKGVLAADKEWKQKLSQPEFADRHIAAAMEESARLFGVGVAEAQA